LLTLQTDQGEQHIQLRRADIAQLIGTLIKCEATLNEIDPVPIPDADPPLEQTIHMGVNVVSTIKSPPYGRWLLMRSGSFYFSVPLLTPTEQRAFAVAASPDHDAR